MKHSFYLWYFFYWDLKISFWICWVWCLLWVCIVIWVETHLSCWRRWTRIWWHFIFCLWLYYVQAVFCCYRSAFFGNLLRWCIVLNFLLKLLRIIVFFYWINMSWRNSKSFTSFKFYRNSYYVIINMKRLSN